MIARRLFLKFPFLAIAIFIAPIANAYTLITYKTDEMSWDRETSVSSDSPDQVVFDSDFLYWQRVRFEVSFITPDFELKHGEEQHLTFYDPIITVKAYSLSATNLVSPLVLGSGNFISFDVVPDEESPWFSFSVNFAEMGDPTDSVFSNGSLNSWGGINPADPYPVNYDEFTFKQFNWPYSRHDQTWYFDTTSVFVDANYNKMTIERISVPEPGAPAQLIMGLLCMALVRKFRQLNASYPGALR